MEIEVKARLRDKETVTSKLAELGCVFSGPIRQDDMVWAEKSNTLDEFLSNTVFLRIRIQDGKKIVLTAKRPKEKTGNESLVKHEYEVVVDSAEQARGILELLGLSEVVRTVKQRRLTKYLDYEICLDDVDDLGAFIEIEKIGNEIDATQIQHEMIELLATLGISSDDFIKKGYDILMLEQKMLNRKISPN